MIVVKATDKEITVTGHAEYAEQGKDIVCAAVSVLTQNLIKCLDTFTEDLRGYVIESGEVIIEYKNLSEQGKLLVDSFFIGICEIAEAYPEYLTIK